MTDADLSEQIEAAQEKLRHLSGRAVDETSAGLRDVAEGLISGFATSLEELRVAEEELRQQNEELVAMGTALNVERVRYQALFDLAPDGYIVTDGAGVIREANLAAGAMLGVRRDRLAGKPLSLFIAEHDVPKFRTNLNRFHGNIRLQGWELMVQPREGKAFPASVTLDADGDAAGEPVLLRWLIRDITESRRLREEIGLQRDTLEETVAERTLALRALTTRLAETEEQERRALATELHDSLGQDLAALRLRVAGLEQRSEGTEIGAGLHEVSLLLAEAIAGARSLTFELSPPMLGALGLESALEWLSERFRDQHGLAVTFRNDGFPKPLGDALQVLLFRAARELLQNVHKHAGTDEAVLSISRDGEEVRVRVADEGQGFDAEAAWRRAMAGEAFGLFSIAERLDAVGGRLEIDSAPGHGTRITMIVRAEEPAADAADQQPGEA